MVNRINNVIYLKFGKGVDLKCSYHTCTPQNISELMDVVTNFIVIIIPLYIYIYISCNVVHIEFTQLSVNYISIDLENKIF